MRKISMVFDLKKYTFFSVRSAIQVKGVKIVPFKDHLTKDMEDKQMSQKFVTVLDYLPAI